jgi:hypothetical protein
MEARLARKSLLLLLGLVLLIRLPFLNQAIQGDDHIYLTEAQHALVDPLHPSDVKYVFLGGEVDLRGHSHPPGNAWPLAGLILLFGDVKRRHFMPPTLHFRCLRPGPCGGCCAFRRQPSWAACCSGGPCVRSERRVARSRCALSCILDGGVALFCADSLVLAAAAMAVVAMMAYQAVLLAPILAVHVWAHGHRRDRARWLVLLVPVITLVAWQVFSRITTGEMSAESSPALSSYGFQALPHKLDNALMLTIHSAWIAFPVGSARCRCMAHTARSGHAVSAGVDRSSSPGAGVVFLRVGALSAAHGCAGCAAGFPAAFQVAGIWLGGQLALALAWRRQLPAWDGYRILRALAGRSRGIGLGG